MWENILINGLISGGVYALLAVGFSLVFGVARIINLAHTAFYMLAAYLIYVFVYSLGFQPLLSALLSIFIVVVIAIISFKLFVDPLREHATAVIIVTVAMALAIQEVMFVSFGGHFRGLPGLVSGFTTVLGVRITNQHLLALGVFVAALMSVWVLLLKTRLGIAIRATAQDREVANLMGMDVARVATTTVAISAALAAVAGAVVAPLFVVEPLMWTHPLIIVMASVILGGLGSIKGAFYGAWMLAFAETIVIFLVPSGAFLRGAFSLVVMLAVLLIRPEGLFGVFFEGER